MVPPVDEKFDSKKEGKDQPLTADLDEDFEEATWGEVCEACCVHEPNEWGMIFIGIGFVCFFLYFFLFGLELLGSGAKVMCGCRAGSLFGDDTNPIAGVMIGILATVLLQSSSTTTSIVVSLVGSDVIEIAPGIYMIMGANIGTSVTSTIVAMGQMGDGDQLERAFAGATVHDMFNFLTVGILLPVEIVTGFLYKLTDAIVGGLTVQDGDKWEGPVKKLVSPLGAKVIKSNKKLIQGIASGDKSCEPGGGYYPINCTDGIETYDTCESVGLISCDKDTNECPLFFSADATASDDKVSGGVVFFIAIVLLFICLLGLITTLQKMLLGTSTRIIHKATNINGYFAIIIGAGITMLVQSSSITTSTLTPLVGMGALRLEQMLPLTLGANIGTTLTALLAAMVSDKIDALQVALAHLCFNIAGILIFYPIPFMRHIPIYLATQLGKATRVWRGFPILYIAVCFVAVPMLLLGVSSLFTQDSIGFTVLGSFIVIILGLVLLYTVYWCKALNGSEKCADYMKSFEERRVLMQNLPEDMEYLKTNMAALLEQTGTTGTKIVYKDQLDLPAEKEFEV